MERKESHSLEVRSSFFLSLLSSPPLTSLRRPFFLRPEGPSHFGACDLLCREDGSHRRLLFRSRRSDVQLGCREVLRLESREGTNDHPHRQYRLGFFIVEIPKTDVLASPPPFLSSQTHHLSLVQPMTDYIVRIEGGKIVANGPVEKVLAAEPSLLVADELEVKKEVEVEAIGHQREDEKTPEALAADGKLAVEEEKADGKVSFSVMVSLPSFSFLPTLFSPKETR